MESNFLKKRGHYIFCLFEGGEGGITKFAVEAWEVVLLPPPLDLLMILQNLTLALLDEFRCTLNTNQSINVR
jgi:hypothetical protein